MTNQELIARFFDKEACEYAATNGGSMFVYNGVLYSYGKHFWLAEFIGADKYGRRCFRVNRGTYRHDPRFSHGNVRMGSVSHTTARQQSLVAHHLEQSEHHYEFVTCDVGEKL